jgi:dsDNA-binding SOS-regulon protein
VNILLLIALITSTQKSVEVRFTQTPPKIDGFIEEVWQQADSVFDFVQSSPYENEKPTEKTSIYLLQDKNNLYVAFRCYADKHKPTANLTKDEDYISFAIDPFQSKTMGYYFWIFGSGIIWDGWVLDDGRNHDDSWEGV